MRFENEPLDREMMERLQDHGIWLSDLKKVTKEQALVFIGEVMLKRFIKEFSDLWGKELFKNCQLKDHEATEEDWRNWLGDDYRKDGPEAPANCTEELNSKGKSRLGNRTGAVLSSNSSTVN